MRISDCGRLFALLLAVLCVGALAGCDLEKMLGVRYEATRTETATLPAPGSPVVEVTSSNGAVSARGVPGQTDVRVTATLRARGRSQAQADARVAAMVIHMEQQGSRIVLAYRASEQPEDVRRYAGVAFDVTMPDIVDLTAATSNGAISVSSLQGRFELDTSNGEITLGAIVGQVTASTSNGRIAVDGGQGVFDVATSNGEIRLDGVSTAVDAVTSNGPIVFRGTPIGGANSLRTSNGRIDIAVPPGAAVEFAAQTSNGKITSALPLVGDTQGQEWLATLNPPATARIDARTSNGAISIVGLP